LFGKEKQIFRNATSDGHPKPVSFFYCRSKIVVEKKSISHPLLARLCFVNVRIIGHRPIHHIFCIRTLINFSYTYKLKLTLHHVEIRAQVSLETSADSSTALKAAKADSKNSFQFQKNFYPSCTIYLIFKLKNYYCHCIIAYVLSFNSFLLQSLLV
jgi:hypothetical protein